MVWWWKAININASSVNALNQQVNIDYSFRLSIILGNFQIKIQLIIICQTMDLCTFVCMNKLCMYKYINHHHHLVVLSAQISLTLSRHLSLSFIASGRSSGLHTVSSQSCCMQVRAGHPAFAQPCAGVHSSTSFVSLSLLLQQCPACLVRLTWIVFMMGGRWPYSCCFVGCCLQDLFNIARKYSCVVAIKLFLQLFS